MYTVPLPRDAQSSDAYIRDLVAQHGEFATKAYVARAIVGRDKAYMTRLCKQGALPTYASGLISVRDVAAWILGGRQGPGKIIRV